MIDSELNLILCTEMSEVPKAEFADYLGNTGYMSFSEVKINGADIFSGNSKLVQEITLREQTDTPALNMYFSIQGISSAWEANSKDKYVLKDNQHAATFAPGFDGYYALSSPEVRNFGIALYEPFFSRLYATDLECLKRFWDKVSEGKIADISDHALPITPKQQSVINDMHHCVYTGNMKQLFYESKITELFLLQAEQADALNGAKPVQIERRHIDKLHAARQYIQQCMFDPLTLSGIAREAGINEFMLKKGFKELFGLTVFGYLNELKMNYARQMLLESQCTVYEAAYTMGYNEPYNFSKAFKKHFGYLPGELKK
ncbi:helix-turn-helix- domain containing protein AraC type [Pedobacter heparinus DSM 2366]|uniref:Helix-turn-helix-domain containing protein AraC type n=2 Tax=Sphingobacteriaceae TaxID=84566 RepID=C6XTQ1_PEDHD|nr:helix-turn-helix- domain containing protein AraC type [Pedobacter heparinus DSM 2366]